MIEQIQKALENYGGTWKNKKGIFEFSTTIAERKGFLSTKKLTYQARLNIDNQAKQIKFSEMLIEAGSGLSSGGFDSDMGMSPGFGFKAETYNTMGGDRKGSIEEQSNLFGKKFEYKFDYREIRSKVEQTAKDDGYAFEYKILPVK
jgi:hypothetical protein